MCHGKACDLPFCSYKGAGVGGGMGRAKSSPSKRGRTLREQAYMATHRNCECPGCDRCRRGGKNLAKVRACWRVATDCDHIGGRGLGGHKRDSARLRAMCHDCHMADPHGRRAL